MFPALEPSRKARLGDVDKPTKEPQGKFPSNGGGLSGLSSDSSQPLFFSHIDLNDTFFKKMLTKLLDDALRVVTVAILQTQGATDVLTGRPDTVEAPNKHLL